MVVVSKKNSAVLAEAQYAFHGFEIFDGSMVQLVPELDEQGN